MSAFKLTKSLIFLIIELNVVFNLPLNMSVEKMNETTTTALTSLNADVTNESTKKGPQVPRDLFAQVNQWNLTNYDHNQIGFYQQVRDNFQNQNRQTTYSPYNQNSNYNNYYNGNMQGNNNNNNQQYYGPGSQQTLPSYSKSFNPYITVPDGPIPVTPQNMWYSKFWYGLTVPIQVSKFFIKLPFQNDLRESLRILNFLNE
jgi:hypothetical protein